MDMLKNTLKELTGEDMASAVSSHGDIDFDPETGTVLNTEHLRDAFGTPPAVMNVWEWCSHYPGETLKGMTVDILDIGYIDQSGAACAPDDEWRRDFQSQRDEVETG